MSELERLQRELAHQRQLSRTVIRQVPAAVAVFDRQLRYVAHSEQWVRDYGLPHESLEGLGHYEVFPEISDHWRAVHRRTLAGETVRSDGEFFERADGRVDWVRWCTQPWRDVDGGICGIIMYTEVLTEQYNAQRSLARAHRELETTAQRLQAVFDQSSRAIALLDLDGRVADCNHLFARRAGQPPELLTGLRIDAVPGWRAALIGRRRPVVDEVLRRNRPRKWTAAVADGESSGEYAISLVPILNEMGAVELLLFEADDVTDRRRVETAMAAKSRFLARMAHEIRTPINAILGFSQLLIRDRGLGRSQREFVETVFRNGENLLELVNSVLDLSKIEAGIASLRLSDFRPHELMEELVRSFAVRVAGRPVRLVMDIDASADGDFQADAGKIRQILTNLLSNAVKFTDQGEIRLAATVDDADDACRLVFTVSDTGCGIPKHQLDRIFDEFVQADSAINVTEGTGLGLAICHQLTRLMGGAISVESEPGQGTSFRASVTVSRLSRPVSKAPAGHTSLRLRAGRRRPCALVVEDLADSRRLLVELLSQAGFEVLEAVEGKAALELLAQRVVDVVLTDLHMPGMDGYRLIRELRSRVGARPAIIAVSADVLSGGGRLALEAGADAFLGKPFRSEQLYEQLATVLDDEFDVVVEDDHPLPTAVQPDVDDELPPELIERIATAAQQADHETLIDCAAAAAGISPQCAAYLRERTEAFDYDAILAFTARASSSKRETP